MVDTIGVVGAGIVGMAVARAVAARGRDVVVLEKEHRVAAHQTGHNSGVVHAGIYYSPGSLKARLSAKGRIATRDYCADKRLPFTEAGKLVVATTAAENVALDELERRARESGVPGLRRIASREIAEIEPHVVGISALHSPHTAVVDYAAITEAMAQDVRRDGGRVLFGHEVRAVRRGGDGVVVETAAGVHRFRRLVVCAGLQSDAVARLVGADPSPRILPFRGEYWELRPDRAGLVRGMVYPVPDPRYPFLGVHFTRGVYGDVHVGPSAVPALAREGYGWGDISLRDTWQSLRWPGAPALLRTHWRMGAKEVAGSLFKRIYFAEARRFIPELSIGDLARRGPSGVRAQAWGRDGALLDDFAVERLGPVTLLRNAPSPAATSAIPIAEYLLDVQRILD